MARSSRRGRLLLLGAAVVAAGVFLYALGPVLVAAAGVSGPVLSFWRLWFGVALLAPASILFIRRTGRRPTPEGWRWAVRAGVAVLATGPGAS